MGVFRTINDSTQSTRAEAASTGFYKSGIGTFESQFPRIEISTLGELLEVKRLEMPAWHEQQTSNDNLIKTVCSVPYILQRGN